MPYFITSESECPAWAVVKEDGEVVACHDTKQSAIDQMVALSIAEDMEPGGERFTNAVTAVITDIDGTIIERGTRPIRDVIDYINSLPGDLFVVTGREERQRATTITTLNNAGLRSFILLMRPDESVDQVSFKAGEAERIAQDYRITHVFENDGVARAAYADLGLTVINPEDFEQSTEPRVDDEPVEERVDDVPQYIQDAAARGLEYNREGYGGDGLTEGTLREARAMARGEMTDDKVVRANAWGARHEPDLDAPQNRDPDHPDWPGAGAVAHYLWGIDPLDPGPARRWLEREVERIRDERKEMQHTEVRTIDAELRAVDESSNGMSFGGYAWRYNEPSLPLPFTERIAPGAFTRTLKSRNDIRAYYNHNDELLLGSTRAKTLRIEDRADGGYVEIDLPDTELGRSTAYHIRRGDITGMSFGFSTVADEWSADGNERTLNEVRLHEVSVVSGVPAYPTTTASVRNLKVIAHRTEMDADVLADAMNALQAGELDDDQANILRTVVDRMTGKDSDPEPTVPLSVLQKQMDLLAKAF